jgi:hypothetical protein
MIMFILVHSIKVHRKCGGEAVFILACVKWEISVTSS